VPALVFGSDKLRMQLQFKLIDYNTPVEEDTVLAQLDDSKFRAAVDQSTAAYKKAEKVLAQAEANLSNAEQVMRRAEQSTLATAAQDLETARYTWKSAVASVEAAKFDIQVALEARRQAMIDLGYTTVRSPCKGVIVDRRVNVGQTVVANLSAPSLFLIAKDLTRLQVWVQVNEADIGHIKEPNARKGQKGTKVTFTVDTFPNEVFEGVVYQIRQNASMTQNVVTYPVIVETDNFDPETGGPGKLKPYLTANVQFKVEERKDALTVPNGALRYRPQLPRIDPAYRDDYERALKKKAVIADETTKTSPGAKIQLNRGTVWVETTNGFVRPLRVVTGLTDGARTEIVEVLENEKLTTDMSVVVGETQNKQSAGGSVNPFAPPPLFKNSKPIK